MAISPNINFRPLSLNCSISLQYRLGKILAEDNSNDMHLCRDPGLTWPVAWNHGIKVFAVDSTKKLESMKGEYQICFR